MELYLSLDASGVVGSSVAGRAGRTGSEISLDVSKARWNEVRTYHMVTEFRGSSRNALTHHFDGRYCRMNRIDVKSLRDSSLIRGGETCTWS